MNAVVVVLGVLIQPPAAKPYPTASKAARAFCTTRAGASERPAPNEVHNTGRLWWAAR
jgi:hypothetical protein